MFSASQIILLHKLWQDFLNKYIFKQNAWTHLILKNRIKKIWFKKLSTFPKVNLDVIQWFPRVWGSRPVANNSPNIKLSAVLALAARMKLKALTVSRRFLKHCPLLQCVKNINWLINILFHVQANRPVTSFHILLMRSVSFSRKGWSFMVLKMCCWERGSCICQKQSCWLSLSPWPCHLQAWLLLPELLLLYRANCKSKKCISILKAFQSA